MIHKINPQVNKQDTLNHLTACNSDYVVYLIKCKCNNIYTGGEGKYECVLVNNSITSWGTIGTKFFNPEPCSDRFFSFGAVYRSHNCHDKTTFRKENEWIF